MSRASFADPHVAPRSERDREILRGLARRIADGDAGARHGLGILYLNRGMLEEAVEQFRGALEIDSSGRLPGHPRAQLLLAQAELRLGRVREALDALVGLLIADPYDLDGLVALGRLLAESGRGADARRALERVARLDPGHSVAAAELRALDPPPAALRRSA